MIHFEESHVSKIKQENDGMNHISNEQQVEEKSKFYCEFCSKPFSGRTKFMTHLQNQEIHYNHMEKCNICGKEFRGNRNLRAHIERVHEDIGRIMCQICGTTFCSKYYLEDHIEKSHQKYGQFSCPEYYPILF